MLLNTVGDKLDIIILAGQSNAEGYGLGACEDEYRPTPNILMMKDTDNQGYAKDEKSFVHFQMQMPRDYLIGIAEERFAPKGKIGCFALSFAREYERKHLAPDRRLLIIQSAVGATGFAKGLWGLGEILYERLCEMTSLALGMNPENRVVAVLWHQGEHDAVFKPRLSDEERFAAHSENLTRLIADFRSRFGTSPFIMGGYTDEWSATCERYKPILDAQLEMQKKFDLVGFASAEGLETNNQTLDNGDKYHFSRNSLDILGKRYFAEYERLI